MENLEKAMEKVNLESKDTQRSEEKPVYDGLKLVEERVYSGPTSIKYWM